MPAEPARRQGAGSYWRCIIRGSGTHPAQFVTVESDRYPNDARIDLDPDMARVQIGDAAVCEVTFGDGGNAVGLRVVPAVVPKAPPIWFAEVRQATASPPAVNLMVFTGAGQPPNTLVDRPDLDALPVATSDQLGALRWYPATGEVDQIYVQPAWRRHNIATALLLAAGSLSSSRGWPSLWGDGQRTEQGERLRNGSSWRRRAADLTHLAPPMTPNESDQPTVFDNQAEGRLQP